MVFFVEVGRDTIANAAELERLSGYPVLATVPVKRIRGARADASAEFVPVFIGVALTGPLTNEPKESPALVKFQREV
jgi:hypothetical protein